MARFRAPPPAVETIDSLKTSETEASMRPTTPLAALQGSERSSLRK
jgi:hypothetical protein